MTSLSWHAPPVLLARFVEDPSGLDDATAASIDAHVVACPACRSAVAALTDPATLSASWSEVADQIDQPRASLVERLLHRVGQRQDLARLVAATPALTTAWFAAVVAIAAAAVAASWSADADGPFLVLAPLVPLAAVGLTFATASDPIGEAGVPTPLHGIGLVLRRALTVLLPTCALVALVATALPQVHTAVLWVLPALALVLGALALATWWGAERAVAVLAVGWVTVVVTVRWLDGRTVAVAESTTFSPTGQLASLAVGLLAAAALVARHDRYATLEVHR